MPSEMDFGFPHTPRGASFEIQSSTPNATDYNPFDSAPPSRGRLAASNRTSGFATPKSVRASTTAFHVPTAGNQKYFRSRRIKDVSAISKPWTEKADPKRKWHTIFPLIGILCGLGLVGLATWQGYTSVINNDYCSIYDVDFTSGGHLDPDVWTKEVQAGGFGSVTQ